VASDEQLDEGTFFGGVHDEGSTLLAEFVLKVLHNHERLENTVATSGDKSRDFLQWVHFFKFFRLQIRIRNHLRVDGMIEPLQSVPQADASSVVAMFHVEESVLWRVAILEADD
jgi:hypothetical protein